MNLEMIRTIVNRIIADINHANYSKHKLYYACGPMGSGKSSFVNDKLLKQKSVNAYHCSIDEYIPYFNEKEAQEAKSEGLYQLCRQIGIMVTDYLLEHKISMIIEGVGLNNDTVEFLDRARKNGYYVHTYFMIVDLETCRERVKIRNNNDRHKVTDEAVIKAHNGLYGENGTKSLIEGVSDIVTEVHHDIIITNV